MVEDEEKEIEDSQLSLELTTFVDCLAALENCDFNLFPMDKQAIQTKLIKLIKQRLDFLDFEED